MPGKAILTKLGMALLQPEDWANATLNRAEASPNLTASLVAAHCRSLPAPYLWTQETRADYGRARRACGVNGLDAYVSDLKRLASVVRELKSENPARRFIWKSLPPQFFAGSGGGNWQGHQTKCQPIPQEHLWKANLRNTIASEVLGASGDFEFVDTFEEELGLWYLHSDEDCTHFCNPSAGTWLAGRELYKRIALR